MMIINRSKVYTVSSHSRENDNQTKLRYESDDDN